MPYQDILSRQDDLGKSHYGHEILVRGQDFAHCREKVLQFFERYQLVRYSQVVVAEDRSISATSRYFEERLVRATRRNRQLVHDLTSELEKEGVNTLHDLSEMPQGYKTKMLHVITHLLDGFFGIDTFFYNLEEDSHWVSEKMREQMLATPSLFWILSIEADI